MTDGVLDGQGDGSAFVPEVGEGQGDGDAAATMMGGAVVCAGDGATGEFDIAKRANAIMPTIAGGNTTSERQKNCLRCLFYKGGLSILFTGYSFSGMSPQFQWCDSRHYAAPSSRRYIGIIVNVADSELSMVIATIYFPGASKTLFP